MNIMVRVLHRYTWLYNQIGDEQFRLDNPNSADENLALTKQQNTAQAPGRPVCNRLIGTSQLQINIITILQYYSGAWQSLRPPD